MTELTSLNEPPPARAAPYVAALGEAGAVAFLLSYGGQVVNVPARPAGNSRLTCEIGEDKVAAIQHELGYGKLRVPVVKRWIAQRLAAAGKDRGEIARELRVTRESVRSYFAPRKRKARP